jgi:flagellar hook-basal body complex protein FliE
MTAPIGYPEKFGVLLTPQRTELPGLKAPGETRAPIGPNFAEQLSQFVSGVNDTEKSAQHQAEEFAVGHSNDIHGTMIATEQADISLRLLGNVRNRVVDLYREVMRMGS